MISFIAVVLLVWVLVRGLYVWRIVRRERREQQTLHALCDALEHHEVREAARAWFDADRHELER